MAVPAEDVVNCQMKNQGLDRAYETTKQVITLSTGIIALTVTFAKEFNVSESGLSVPVSLKISWLLYCASVIFGVWTLMAITGTLRELDKSDANSNQNGTNIRIPAGLMMIAFVGGIVTTIWSGFLIAR
jgi:hypothetical protein